VPHDIRANEADNVPAIHRWDCGGEGDDVVVLVNLANAVREDCAIGLPAAGEWRTLFNTDRHAFGAIGKDRGSATVQADGPARDGLPTSAVVGLPPYGVLILGRPGEAPDSP
jgi:1,4-alpha-glucan branching enzyme